MQNLLLTLGGLLLAGAALVFAVVTYERLGAGGRAAVLAALTLLAGLVAPRLRTRGLVSTAETVGVVALALAALDAYGLRTLGLADASSPLAYAAGSAAVLAAGAVAYGSLTGLRIVRALGVVAAQLPVLLLLADSLASAATAGLVLAALAGADCALLLLRRLPDEVAAVLRACAVVVTGLALAASLLASAALDEPTAAAAALVACALVLAAGSRLASTRVRPLLTGGAVLVLGAAVHALVRDDTATTAWALAATGLVAALAASRLPRSGRTGPTAGALLVAGCAVLLVGEAALEGALAPLTWLLDPWSLASGSSARDAARTLLELDRPCRHPAGAARCRAGHRRRRPRPAPAAPRRAAGRGARSGRCGARAARARRALAAGADRAAGARRGAHRRRRRAARSRRGRGAGRRGRRPGPARRRVVGRIADRDARRAAADRARVRRPGRAALAAARRSRPARRDCWRPPHAAALGSALDLAADQVGGLLLLPVGGALLAAALLDARRRHGAEATALVGAAAALALAAGDVGWLSWVLAGLGLLALATALRPDRRAVAAAGGLLLSASSWVRLADAGVHAPEPYVLPLAAVALLLGGLRRRAEPATRSWAAYGPGLLLALVPSLLAGLGDDELTRLLLVGLAALAVLLAGARSRLQAPLAVGGAVLAVVALDLVGPYAAALPRWLSLGGAGTLLLVVGATYEQRRRDLARLREGFDALA